MNSLVGYLGFLAFMFLMANLVEARAKNKKLVDTLDLIGMTAAQIELLAAQKDKLSQLVDAVDVLNDLHLKVSAQANAYGFSQLIGEGYTQDQAKLITGLYLIGKPAEAKEFERTLRKQNEAARADKYRALAQEKLAKKDARPTYSAPDRHS